MSVFIAILGLAFLILVHEAGHFFTALAVGMRPRRFYVGFPPAIVKTTRRGIEYGVGMIPLGGYVKIPGMHRLSPRDAELHFGRALREAPELIGPTQRLKRALEADDEEGARAAVAELERLGGSNPPEGFARAVQEVDDALSPHAYWRQRTWKRVAVIFAGPGTNALLAIVLFAGVYMVPVSQYRLGFMLEPQGQDATAYVESVLPGKPAARSGLRAGDRILAINGVRVTANSIRPAISRLRDEPLRLTVVRHGKQLVLHPARAYHDVITGESPPRAFWSSLRVTGQVTKAIGLSLGRLFHGEGRKEVSSPIGIVKGSQEAVRQGAREYLTVLGLISLSLALLNLLPLLPLDGGHIAFSLIEGVRGRAVAREVYERVSAVGIALVLLLFFVGIRNDISNLGGS